MGGKSKVKRAPGDRYLAIPYHILNLRNIGLCEKVLLAHIYSFGQRGCYQSNKTLADIFMVLPGTISRWIADVRTHLYIKNPKGYYRTMWAKTHPEVQAATVRWHKSDGAYPVHLGKSEQHVVQKSESDFGKSEIGHMHRCATTNNNTNKETSAPLPPMPAGGQAAAVLTEREAEQKANIEQYKQRFGIGKKKWKPLTEQEFNQKRQKQLNALLAG